MPKVFGSHHSDPATVRTMPFNIWRSHVSERLCTHPAYKGVQVPLPDDPDQLSVDVNEWLWVTQRRRLHLWFNTGETVLGALVMLSGLLDGTLLAGREETVGGALRACRRVLARDRPQPVELRVLFSTTRGGAPRATVVCEGARLPGGVAAVLYEWDRYLERLARFDGDGGTWECD